MNNHIPLVVDLDHTLIDTDLLYESSIGVLRKNPLLILLFPIWLLKGKGYLKDQLVQRFSINVSALPYNQKVIDYITSRKENGDKIILATASHKTYAFAIGSHLKITSETKSETKQSVDLFDEVMASNKSFNLSSHNKADKLIERFGNKGFDYMGDHQRDLPVWEVANMAILVNVSQRIIRKTQHLNTLVLSEK